MINKKVILKIIFLTSIVFLLSIIFRSENAKAATATSKVNGVTWTYTYTTGGSNECIYNNKEFKRRACHS